MRGMVAVLLVIVRRHAGLNRRVSSRSPRVAVPALLVIAAVVALAGCSSSESSAPPRDDPTTPSPRPTTTGGERSGAQNTGFLEGTQLKKSESIRVTKDGKTIEGVDVTGTIRVAANDVTIRNSRVRVRSTAGIYLESGFRGLRIEDVTIDGRGSAVTCAGIAPQWYTAVRVNVFGCGDGLKMGEQTTLQDSYVHDLGYRAGSHNDGVQIGSGHNIEIVNSTIVNALSQTSAVLAKADFGDISNLLIEGNYLDGGAYTLYARSTSRGQTTGVVIRNNVFGPHRSFGLLSEDNPVVWQGNKRSNGRPIRSPHEQPR